MAFLPCVCCRRHVRDDDAACPFCGHAITEKFSRALPMKRLARGALFAFASVVAGCGGSDESTTTTTTDTGTAASDTSTATDTGTKTDTGSATDTGTATDSATTPTDSSVTDSNTTTDTGTKTDAASDGPTDGGAAPLYGLPPTPS